MLSAGGAPSSTVTVKAQVLVLPAASTAVTVTVLVPKAKAEPEGGLAVRLASAQLSVADGVKLTTAGHAPLAVTVMFAGQVMTGAVLSTTTTRCVTMRLALPLLSVAR